jgi:hypothetical protein
MDGLCTVPKRVVSKLGGFERTNGESYVGATIGWEGRERWEWRRKKNRVARTRQVGDGRV